MLTQAENEQLTRVGPGTPMGDLLRRYWYPIAPVQDLSDDSPTRFVRILGEDLVLWKDHTGRVGLIQDHCPHRGASLLYGRVEERGIACAYHGWLYDTQGNCLETPAEPADSNFYLTVKATAYPVQKFLGMYWTYLGPPPAPVIPHYDAWVREDLRHWLVLGPNLDCNWLQAVENAVDPYHSAILHQDSQRKPGLPNTTRGTVDGIDHIECFMTSYGIMKRHYYKSGSARQHPMVFPNILVTSSVTQINIPIDDTHTGRVRLYFVPRKDGEPADGDELPLSYGPPNKLPADSLHPIARFNMRDADSNDSQDGMVFETQGLIADRTTERLATSDQWIAMLRDLYQENISAVQNGEDPFAVEHDPNHPMITFDIWNEVKNRIGEAYGSEVGEQIAEDYATSGAARAHLPGDPSAG